VQMPARWRVVVVKSVAATSTQHDLWECAESIRCEHCTLSHMGMVLKEGCRRFLCDSESLIRMGELCDSTLTRADTERTTCTALVPVVGEIVLRLGSLAHASQSHEVRSADGGEFTIATKKLKSVPATSEEESHAGGCSIEITAVSVQGLARGRDFLVRSLAACTVATPGHRTWLAACYVRARHRHNALSHEAQLAYLAYGSYKECTVPRLQVHDYLASAGHHHRISCGRTTQWQSAAEFLAMVREQRDYLSIAYLSQIISTPADTCLVVLRWQYVRAM
jgi:hypothetical protein